MGIGKGSGRGRVKGCIPWHKGLTKETDPRVKAMGESRKGTPAWSKGLTKDTDPRVKAMADKMVIVKMGNIPWNKGLTKEDHPSLALIGSYRKGHTKENDPIIARHAKEMKGRLPWNTGLTMDVHPGLKAISIKKTGRTKETDAGVLSQSIKKTGRNKSNDPSVQRQSQKLTGRTKATHPYLVAMAEKRKKYHGDKSFAWKGGISLESYPDTFNISLKRYVRDRDGHICQGCGVSEKHCRRKLDVHHIDYDKINVDKDNLISLCRSCHGRVNENREYWKRLLKDKLIIKSSGILVYG